jgi:hypothetical protein
MLCQTRANSESLLIGNCRGPWHAPATRRRREQKGGEAPTEVKPTTRGAELTGEGGAAAAHQQFPTRGGGIQCQKAGTWPHRSEGEGKGLRGG